MANFQLEDILKEYGPDGKRSGIQCDTSRPMPRGTLETEKLVSAATSQRPLMQEKAGYRSATEPEVEEVQLEDLVDIKSTISQIKAQKDARTAHSADVSPLLRERFPTQHLKCGDISYLNSGRKQRFDDAENVGEVYDGVVKLMPSPDSETDSENETAHQPNIRQMEDATRAKEKKRRRRRKMTESFYPKESVFGVAKPLDAQPDPDPVSRRRWDEEQDFYYHGGQDGSTVHSVRQRMHRQTGSAATQQPDDLQLVCKNLYSLWNVIFFRCMALLVLTLAGIVLAMGETSLVVALTPRGYAIVELVLILLGGAISFPILKNGLWHWLRFRADSDSMAALPAATAAIGTILVMIAPETLSQEMVHLYVPCAMLALFCNAIGRLLVVRRALRNCNVLSHEGQKRVMAYISQEEVAELLTRELIYDVPIVAAVRKADATCDFLRYTYSMDAADALCRIMTPVSMGLSVVIAVCLTVIRVGFAPSLLWFSVLFSMITLLVTASCCLASTLVSNLPLERESKKAVASGSAILGYQSADDFFDVNALLVEASDLFPKGSVQIQGMKVFSGAKVDDVLLDTASLVNYTDSILQDAFSEMIPDHEALRAVDSFVCEDGFGLCGWIANRRVLFGGREMMANHNIEGLPTKAHEVELAEGNDDVLYLSVSGVLSAMFSIQILADPEVCRQMRALRQEHISLVIHSVDHAVTLQRIHALFDFPEHLMKRIPTSMHHLFDRETADLGCVSASMTVGGTGFGAAQLLLGVRHVRRASTMGVILQIVSSLLGFSLAMIHVITGAYEEMTAEFFLFYHLLMTAVTALAVRVR